MTIKELREMSGKSQNDFARRYGIALKRLQAWENGESEPPAFTLKIIEKAVRQDLKIKKDAGLI